jgi:lipoprotein-releasing system permease protein
LNSRSWIGFIAGRYVVRRRKSDASPSVALAVLGISIGVLALTVILAVMNGFQLGFIESIVEVSSYHIRIDDFPEGVQGEILRAKVLDIPQITAAVPFREFQGIIRGNRENQLVAVVRGLPADAAENDQGMASKLQFESGLFNLWENSSIILGTELARSMAVHVGDTVNLVSISAVNFAAGNTDTVDAAAQDSRFTVTGIFRTGFAEYDQSLAFISLDTARFWTGENGRPSLGIKLQSRWQDNLGMEKLLKIPELAAMVEAGSTIRPWRDYDRAYFSALRTEKLLMFTLVGLIFIVVGVNIFQAQRRQVLERREEIGLLRAVGASDLDVRLIFVWDGFIIGLTGAGLGTVLGLLLASHIKVFFHTMEGIANFFIDLLNSFLYMIGGTGYQGFAIFSPTIFYIQEIPSRIIPYEVIIIFFFGFLSALLAAWFASRRVSKEQPAEVLRYE